MISPLGGERLVGMRAASQVQEAYALLATFRYGAFRILTGIDVSRYRDDPPALAKDLLVWVAG